MNDDAPSTAPSGEQVAPDGHQTHEGERHAHRRSPWRGGWLDYLVTMVAALVIAVLVKTFLVQPFWIPSASMNPTLVQDDKILVSKLSPGIVDLDRGDVIVFEDADGWIPEGEGVDETVGFQVSKVLSWIGLAPDPAENHLVKRLIGMPGDQVACSEKGADLEVNGVTVDEPYVAEAGEPCQNEFSVTVPSGSVWVLGDNRYDSADSAYHHQQGENAFIPLDDVTGKAVVVFWPMSNWASLNGGDESFAAVPDAS